MLVAKKQELDDGRHVSGLRDCGTQASPSTKLRDKNGAASQSVSS